MMISHRSWLSVTAVVAATVAFSAACSSGKKSKGTGTPTPLQLSITNYYSNSGNKTFHPGECAGLKVTEATGQLNQNTVVFVINSAGSGYQLISNQQNGGVLAINATAGYFTIGGGAEYPCITWGLDATPGKYDMDVITPFVGTTNTAAGTVLDAIEFAAAPVNPILSLGTGAGSATSALATVHDNDYFTFKAGLTKSVLEISSTDTSGAFAPFQEAFLPDYSNFLNPGFDAVIDSPTATTKYVNFVTNYWGGIETGWPYTMTLSTNAFATHNSGTDKCDDTALPIVITSTPVYLTGSNNAMAADYDPQGAISGGCFNTYFKWFSPYTPGHPPITLADGDGVFASGKDSVLKVTVPSHKSLIVSMQGENAVSTIDAAVYIVKDTGTGNEATDCKPKPDNCLAANDTFGANDATAGSNGTDGTHWYNAGLTPQNVYVIIDAYGTAANPPGTGKWNVYLNVK